MIRSRSPAASASHNGSLAASASHNGSLATSASHNGSLATSASHNGSLATSATGSRAAFTLLECAVALALLAAVAVVAAEMATAVLGDRSRSEARFEAEQVAQNVLETARATSWKDLTAEWAKAQKVPPNMLDRWPNTKLVVKVEPEPDRPRVKRVMVEVGWNPAGGPRWPAVTITAFFAARTAGAGK